LPSKNIDAAPHRSLYSGGTLGIGAGTFSNVEVGCVGAVIIVMLCVAAVGGLVAMVFWSTYRS
jgi:hypothetical protein